MYINAYIFFESGYGNVPASVLGRRHKSCGTIDERMIALRVLYVKN